MKIKIPSIEQFKESFRMVTGKDPDRYPISFADFCYWLPHDWFGYRHEVAIEDGIAKKGNFVIPSWMYEVVNE